MDIAKDSHIIDTTLREGEQTPGLLFSIEQKKRILNGLVEIGIPEAELGISSKLNPCTAELIKYCRTKLPELQLSLWSRCKKEDIQYAAALSPDFISLSIPVSDLHLTDRLKKDRGWALSTMVECIDYAKEKGLKVSIGFEDATRAEVAFLHQMARAAELHGASRIRLADTVGIASPLQFAKLTGGVKTQLSTAILAVHTHNDFGMATANAIAALESGATSVDGVILGLGERTGCARLEELVAYLSLARETKTLKPESLKELASLVARLAGRKINGNQPIVGDDIFTCETGLHLQGLQEKPETYEPFCPSRVRGKRKFLFGAKTGRRAIMQRLAQLQPSQPKDISNSTLQKIRETASRLRRPLEDRELAGFIN